MTLRIGQCALIAALATLQINSASAEGELHWVQPVSGPVADLVFALDTTRDGGVVVAGAFDGTIDITPGRSLTSAGSDDVFLSAYGRDGEATWSLRAGGPGDDQPRAIAGGSGDELVVVGYFFEHLDVGDLSVSSDGGADAFLLRLGTGGEPRSLVRWGGKYADSANAVATDASGHVFVGGSFQLTTDFDPGSGRRLLTSRGGRDGFVTKLDRSGNALWAARIGGTRRDEVVAVLPDGEGGVYAAGSFQGDASYADDGPTVSAVGARDLFLLRITADGTLDWIRRVGGAGADRAVGLAASADGAPYLVAGFQNELQFDEGACAPVHSAGSEDLAVSRWSAEGSCLWVRAIGSAQPEIAQGVHGTDDGGIIVTGYFQDTVDFDPGTKEASLAPIRSGDVDTFVVQLTADGTHAWSRRLGGTAVEQGIAVATTEDRVYLAGIFNEEFALLPAGALKAHGKTDVFVLQFAP